MTARSHVLADLMPANNLIAALREIGVSLDDVKKDAECQVYLVTTPDGGVVYVGTSEAANAGRIGYERDSRHDLFTMTAGFPRLFARYRGVHQKFRIGEINRRELRLRADKHLVSGFDAVKASIDHIDFSPKFAEALLIRTVVQAGYVLGNSAHAGQWARKTQYDADDLAYLAVLASRNTDHDLTIGIQNEIDEREA